MSPMITDHADHLSHVWSKVTDLEVASGDGSWVTTTGGEHVGGDGLRPGCP